MTIIKVTKIYYGLYSQDFIICCIRKSAAAISRARRMIPMKGPVVRGVDAAFVNEAAALELAQLIPRTPTTLITAISRSGVQYTISPDFESSGST